MSKEEFMSKAAKCLGKESVLKFKSGWELGQALRLWMNDNGYLSLPLQEFRVRPTPWAAIFLDNRTPMSSLLSIDLTVERHPSSESTV